MRVLEEHPLTKEKKKRQGGGGVSTREIEQTAFAMAVSFHQKGVQVEMTILMILSALSFCSLWMIAAAIHERALDER